MPRRYAVAGTGSRARSYVRAIFEEHPEEAQLVALLDPNPGRLAFHDRYVQELGGPELPHYGADDLERMVKEQSVDRVVVTSPDYTHASVVSRLLRAGADVIVEKPLTIDADGTRQIVDAMTESGKSVVVTFNYRYSPRNSALRQVIADGEIGKVTSVEFQWVLDTRHGADYFRRWHREKKISGGLMVHKASHHFDLVNWWIASTPTRVFASGGLSFYGADNAATRGLGQRPERGTIDGSANDPWLLDLRNDDVNRQLYLGERAVRRLPRDQDVFGPGITIEDNMSVIAEYANGARLSYSLNAHSPWEGYRVCGQRHRGPRRTRGRRAGRGDRRSDRPELPVRARDRRRGAVRRRAARPAETLGARGRGRDPARCRRSRRRRPPALHRPLRGPRPTTRSAAPPTSTTASAPSP